MIRYKTVYGGKTLVIEDGKLMMFGTNGVLEQENVPYLVSYSSNLLEGNFVSILMSGDVMEICTLMSTGEIKRIERDRNPLILQKFLDFGNIVRVLQRQGKEQGIRYNQMIYIYKSDIDINWIVEEILKTC